MALDGLSFIINHLITAGKNKSIDENLRYACRRLAENLAVDMPSLEPDAFGLDNSFYPKHGNNVGEKIEQRFNEAVEKKLKILSSYKGRPKALIKKLLRISLSLYPEIENKHPVFPTIDNHQNICNPTCFENSPEPWFTRYISMKDFYHYYVKLNFPKGDVSDDIKKEISLFLDKKLNRRAFNLNPLWLGIPDGLHTIKKDIFPKPIWITPLKSAPHLSEEYRETCLTDKDRARFIVQKTGLPRYESDELMQDEVGLLAIEFKLEKDIDIFKPTVMDAVDSAYFFPGPKNESWGFMRCLNHECNKIISKMEYREVISKSFRVKIKIGREKKVEKIGFFI